MEFPEINTKATNFTITPQIRILLEQKFAALGKFLDIHNVSHCEVELEKITEQHSGKIYRAEVNFTNGGKFFRTEAIEEQMEQAIDNARNELKNELQRAHGKKMSLVRRGGQIIKNMLRFDT